MRYLESTLGYTLRRAQMAVFQDIYRAFGKAGEGITLTQFSVMAVAADNPDITQTELAEVLAVERPRIVPILDRLEARGLAVRRVCGVDRRNRRISLTDAGSSLLADLKLRFAHHEARVALTLGTDCAVVHAALQSLHCLPALDSLALE
jgi:DNA-binding MarR family transcriptional regulator